MAQPNAAGFIGQLTAPPGLKINGQEVSPGNFNDTVAKIVEFVLQLAFGVAVLLVLGNMIYGAYLWITSGGKPDKIASGRSRIIWAVVGLLLVGAAYGLTVLIQGIFIENGGKLQIDLIK